MGRLIDERDSPDEVCIKRIVHAQDAELDSFLKEAATIVGVEHPQIAKLHYFGRTPEGCYLAFAMIDGVNLATLLRAHGPLGRRLTLYVATRIADALSACHARGLVHRDVSPGNIMLTARGEVVLLDLGVARARGRGSPTRIDMAAGKPAYAAPEYGLHDQSGPLSDLYSLGAVMYECLTGMRPHEAISAQQTFELAAAAKHPQLLSQAPRTPAALAELVEALLDPTPRARPRDAALVRARLQAIDAPRDIADELRTLVLQVARRSVPPRVAPGVPSPAVAVGPRARSTPPSGPPPRLPGLPTGAPPTLRPRAIWGATAAMVLALAWLCMRLLR